MSMVTATLKLYREAARDSIASIRRSFWAAVFLLAAYLGIVALSPLLGLAGFAGGFIMFLVYAGLTGWYLSLVEIAVSTRRAVKVGDVRDNVGAYFSEMINIMFIFFLPEFLIGMASPEALLVLVPAACLAFNPIPEMLYQERSGGLEMIKDSAVFMQQNWPEWLGGHVVMAGLLAGVGWALSGVWSPEWMIGAAQMFGPWFGFMHAGAWVLNLGENTPLSLGLFVLVFVFAHCFMVFRGHLYRGLRASSRRGRAWKAKV